MEILDELLERAQAGDEAARERAFAAAYNELRVHARSMLRSGGRSTLLDTNVLVHESFVRFKQAGRLQGADRGHFFAYAGRIMRSVVVDFARKRQTERRGGDRERVTMNTQIEQDLRENDEQALRIDEVLQALQDADSRLVQVVEMRCFVGMTIDEIANALGVAERTVRRDWEKAKLLMKASARGSRAL